MASPAAAEVCGAGERRRADEDAGSGGLEVATSRRLRPLFVSCGVREVEAVWGSGHEASAVEEGSGSSELAMAAGTAILEFYLNPLNWIASIDRDPNIFGKPLT